MVKLQRLFIVKFIALVLVFFIFQGDFSAYVNAQESDYAAHFSKARQDYQQGNYQEVTNRLERLLAYVGDENKELLGKIYLLLGAAYEQQGKIIEARKHYTLCKQFLKKPVIEGLDFSSLIEYQTIILGKRPGEAKDDGIIRGPEIPGPGGKKKKKFPVLLVVAGIAVVVVLVALLGKKKSEPKKYTLNVTRGEGVDGSPNSGALTYNEGTVVNYNYSLQSGYKDLEVRLDGAIVSASGSITMNGDHTLTANAGLLNRYTLSVTKGAGVVGSPDSGVFTYDEGAIVNYSYSLQVGYTNLVVILDGATVPASGTITMNGNHNLTVSASLAGDNPPVVTITSPGNGDTVSGTVTIRANAADDKGISKVEFYIDNVKKSMDTASPYKYTWNTTEYANGSHVLKVTAYDTSNQTNEDEISVTVNNYDYDIRGSWLFSIYGNPTLEFRGTKTSGNVYVMGESQDRGDYSVDGNEVKIMLYDEDFDNVGKDWKYTFNGKFDSENEMSGNFLWENYNNGILEEQETGKWNATKN
jgi:hypothetical protein